MSSTYVDRPKRTNAPIQPKSEETTMKLKECITCGSHSFTNGKCDYCGNQYEVKQNFMKELKIAPLSDYMKSLTEEELKDIYNNLKDGLTPNQIRTATCKENLVKKEELDFKDTPEGKKLLKVMIWVLISIIWFAITVFIPPLFIITIILLVVYSTYRLTIKNK